jgi:glycosyltransferase involved in cell wall biosynthesis
MAKRRLESISIVVPLYNEESSLRSFHEQLAAVLNGQDWNWQIIYVDDGSEDGTRGILDSLKSEDGRVAIVSLSRNFGHQAALTAGIDHSGSDAIITMDGDGEHPSSMLPEMVELYELGYDIVQMQRSSRSSLQPIKRWTGKLFYSLLGQLSRIPVLQGVSDFRLISRKVADALHRMPEYHRYLRGMVSWVGFHWVVIPYKPGRRIAGKSKYSLRKMLKLAFDAIFSFSLIPLFIGLIAGLGFLFLAVLEAIYVLQFWIRGDLTSLEPGWSSLMFMLLIIGGTTSILLGIIGVYIGYIFQEVKRRPVYIVSADEE